MLNKLRPWISEAMPDGGADTVDSVLRLREWQETLTSLTHLASKYKVRAAASQAPLVVAGLQAAAAARPTLDLSLKCGVCVPLAKIFPPHPAALCLCTACTGPVLAHPAQQHQQQQLSPPGAAACRLAGIPQHQGTVAAWLSGSGQVRARHWSGAKSTQETTPTICSCSQVYQQQHAAEVRQQQHVCLHVGVCERRP